MRKFKHFFTKEIKTEDLIINSKEYRGAVEKNYNDEELFGDWLISEKYTPLQIYRMDADAALKLREDYLEWCREVAFTDLDYDEIFLD